MLFEVLFLEEALKFLKSMDAKHAEKILYNIRKAQTAHDPELFKKLTDEIWEFRTLFQGLQYRMLAFWDKSDNRNTLVISSHGFIKKRSKVPDNEFSGQSNCEQNILMTKKKVKRNEDPYAR